MNHGIICSYLIVYLYKALLTVERLPSGAARGSQDRQPRPTRRPELHQVAKLGRSDGHIPTRSAAQTARVLDRAHYKGGVVLGVLLLRA